MRGLAPCLFALGATAAHLSPGCGPGSFGIVLPDLSSIYLSNTTVPITWNTTLPSNSFSASITTLSAGKVYLHLRRYFNCTTFSEPLLQVAYGLPFAAVGTPIVYDGNGDGTQTYGFNWTVPAWGTKNITTTDENYVISGDVYWTEDKIDIGLQSALFTIKKDEGSVVPDCAVCYWGDTHAEPTSSTFSGLYSEYATATARTTSAVTATQTGTGVRREVGTVGRVWFGLVVGGLLAVVGGGLWVVV